MKKIVYLLTLITLVFSSCSDIEDTFDELDTLNEGSDAIVGDVIFTMDVDDYELTNDSIVFARESFINYEQAELLIPTMLANKYPVWGEKSSALVTFSYDRTTSIKTEITDIVTDDDYTDLGFGFPNFGDNHQDDAAAFLVAKYPEALRGDLVELTYDFYDGNVNNVTNKFVFTDEWLAIKELESEDYTAMEQSFTNFSSFETADFRIGIYLATLPEYTFIEAGEQVNIIYNYTYFSDSGRVYQDVLTTFTYDGTKFSAEPNTIQFGHDGDIWVKDNTIKYTFTVDDYTTVGESTILENDTEDDFINALGNLNNFGNFNRTGSSSSWSDEMMVKAMAVFLDGFDSIAEDGQKYIITVTIFGDTSTESYSMIKEDGIWILNE